MKKYAIYFKGETPVNHLVLDHCTGPMSEVMRIIKDNNSCKADYVCICFVSGTKLRSRSNLIKL